MEELSIDDLTLESGEVFDAFAAGGDVKPIEGGKAPEAPEVPNTEEIKPPVSEENDSPESVATEEGKNNQGQAGKATDDEGSNSSSPKLNDSEQLYSTLAAQFVKKGVLPDLDPKEVKSIEDIENALAKRAESMLTDKQRAINEAIKVGAPVDAVSNQVDLIERLSSIDEDIISNSNNEGLRLDIIAQDFQNRGYEKERALVLAQRSIDAGTGVEDAKFALQGILSTERKRYEDIINKAKEEDTRTLTDIQSFIQKNDEIVPGIKLNTVQKDDIYKQMTTDVGNKESEFIKYQKENPIDSRIKLETIFYLTKGLSDFSVFGATAKTEAAKSIEDLLRGTNFTEDGKVQTEVKDSNSNFTLSDLQGLEIGD